MKNPKQFHDLVRQNEKNVKKPEKHDANLQKNTTFYFQLGLIVCLLAAYALLEMKFESKIPEIVKLDLPNEVVYVDEPPVFVVEKLVKKLPKQEPEPSKNNFQEVPNDTPIPFEDNEPKEIDVPAIDLKPDAIVVEPSIEDNPEVPFHAVEVVPIYPGCENKKTNQERRKCMADKITKLVQKKFDTDLGGELGLTGKQVIQTQFKINASGLVKEVKVRAPHPDLEKEAKRVINFIPEMEPGKQRDKNVSVIYTLPIIFQVQN